MLLTAHRTCWPVVKDPEVIFDVVPLAVPVVTRVTCVPDNDHHVVRFSAGAVTTDLDDCSHVTIAAVLIPPLRLPVIATYHAQSHHCISAGLQ